MQVIHVPFPHRPGDHGPFGLQAFMNAVRSDAASLAARDAMVNGVGAVRMSLEDSADEDAADFRVRRIDMLNRDF